MLLTTTDYDIDCLMTNIVDLDSITCDIEPDRTKVLMFQSHICALGCAPYPLPVWKTGFETYELYPTETNAAMHEALSELAAAGLSPDRVTVIIAPSKEHAAMLACFVAEFDDD